MGRQGTATGDVKRRAPMPRVRSVERVGQLMEALLTTPEGSRLSDLSQHLGLHKTTVFRLLRTLMGMKLVLKDEADDRYYWNPLRWMLVARSLQSTTAKLDLTQTVLQELADLTGQTAVLSVPDMQGRNMLQVACAVSRSPVRVDLTGRLSAPLHAVAAGKAYLATFAPGELEDYLRRDRTSLTVHTVTAVGPLLAQLEQARARGYAVAHQEYALGASGMAVSIHDEQGAFAGALAITGPSDYYTPERTAGWLPALQATAVQLLQALYPGVAPVQPQARGASAEPGVSPSGTTPRRSYRVL